VGKRLLHGAFAVVLFSVVFFSHAAQLQSGFVSGGSSSGDRAASAAAAGSASSATEAVFGGNSSLNLERSHHSCCCRCGYRRRQRQPRLRFFLIRRVSSSSSSSSLRSRTSISAGQPSSTWSASAALDVVSFARPSACGHLAATVADERW
jgi:hypothetical protein